MDQMVDQIMAHAGANEAAASGPGGQEAARATHAKVLEQARKSGFVRVKIDGHLYDLSEEIKLEKNIQAPNMRSW